MNPGTLDARTGARIESTSDRGPVARRPAAEVLVALLLMVLSCVYFVGGVWLDERQAWMHPELLSTASSVWEDPVGQNTWDRLSIMVQWNRLDPTGERVRPLNDVAEVVDAVARPYLTQVWGPHPSVTVSSLLTVTASPILLFATLRGWGLDGLRAAGLIAVFVSSVAFESVHVSDIHPAKRLTILFTCLTLFLGERYARRRASRAFICLIVCLYLSFFADEMDLIIYPIVGLIFFTAIFRKTSIWVKVAFLSLPFLFLAAVLYGLPALYAAFGEHWNTFDAGNKLDVLRYLQAPEFYRVSIIHMADAMLTSVGVKAHTQATLWLALGSLVLVSAGLVRQGWRRSHRAAWPHLAIASLVSLLGAAVFATLVDWFAFAGKVWYLGDYTYYYHSSLTVLVIVWLAAVWHGAGTLLSRGCKGERVVLWTGVGLCAIATVANFALFREVNRLVLDLHTYPYGAEALQTAVSERRMAFAGAGQDDLVVVPVVPGPRTDIEQEYMRGLRDLYGDAWQANDFYFYWEFFRERGGRWDETLTQQLVRAYFPYHRSAVVVRPDLAADAPAAPTSPDTARAARDAQRKRDLRTLQAELGRFHAQYGRYPCPGDNTWLSSSAGANWLVAGDVACAGPRVPTPDLEQAPLDPINTGGSVWLAGQYTYAYRGYNASLCPTDEGQYYILAAQLEDTSDPDGLLKAVDCDGSTIGWPDGVFVLTSGLQR